MRINPKKLLQGLLFLAPITLLALASCGGGGGGSSATLASAYTLYVSVTGVSAASSPLVLRNGGENLTISTSGTHAFQNQVLSGTTYNISVLTQPSSPTQLCTFSNSTTSLVGVMPASAKTVNVSCAIAYKIGGNISGLSSDGLVLQNNGGDNYQAASSVTGFNFKTPVINGGTYNVTILAQPQNRAQTCSVSGASGTVSTVSGDVTNVAVNCTTYTQAPADPYVYAANSGSTNNVYAYNSASGVLATNGLTTQGSGRAAIAGDRAGKFVFIASGTSSGSVASYKIGTTGALAKTNEVATGNTPFAIAVHPSGQFAYVVNKLSNSVSAYSINTTTGALASIDANGATTTYESSITTAYSPVAITIDASGTHLYVASLGSNTLSNTCGNSAPSLDGCLSAYTINASTGALTSINISGSSLNVPTGAAPSSITVDPADKYVYVTNLNSTFASMYAINADGTLTTGTQVTLNGGTGATSMAVFPDGTFAYVTNSSTSKVDTYGRNTSNGALTYSTSIATGSTPNSITIDSSGQYAYVANTVSNSISVFSISGGALAKVGCPGGSPSATCTVNSNFVTGTSPVAIITAP